MKYFIELTLIGTNDFYFYQLWSKVYTQLHLAFVEIKDQDDKINVGVSLPEYQFNEEKKIGFLGTKLRIFANTEEELQKIDIKSRLERLNDYVHISSTREVPEHKITSYSTFSRKQVKTSAERLARHRIKRGNIDFTEAKNRYQNVVTTTDLPFIQLKSLTNQQPFKLFIEKRVSKRSIESKFSTYGLSSTSSVPEF